MKTFPRRLHTEYTLQEGNLQGVRRRLITVSPLTGAATSVGAVERTRCRSLSPPSGLTQGMEALFPAADAAGQSLTGPPGLEKTTWSNYITVHDHATPLGSR